MLLFYLLFVSLLFLLFDSLPWLLILVIFLILFTLKYNKINIFWKITQGQVPSALTPCHIFSNKGINCRDLDRPRMHLVRESFALNLILLPTHILYGKIWRQTTSCMLWAGVHEIIWAPKRHLAAFQRIGEPRTKIIFGFLCLNEMQWVGLLPLTPFC